MCDLLPSLHFIWMRVWKRFVCVSVVLANVNQLFECICCRFFLLLFFLKCSFFLHLLFLSLFRFTLCVRIFLAKRLFAKVVLMSPSLSLSLRVLVLVVVSVFFFCSLSLFLPLYTFCWFVLHVFGYTTTVNTLDLCTITTLVIIFSVQTLQCLCEMEKKLSRIWRAHNIIYVYMCV